MIVQNNYMESMLYYILRLLTAWLAANATIMLNYLFMPVSQYRQAVTEIYIGELQLENSTLCYKIV